MTCEVKECYEFERCSGKFFEVGDTVGFHHLMMLAGCKMYRGEVEEVNTVERKVKVYCQHYPKPPCPKQHLNFIVRYEALYLIKGTDCDEEGDLTFDMYDVEELDVCND